MPHTPIGGTKDLVCESCQQVWHSRNNRGRWCPECRAVRRKEQARSWHAIPENRERRREADRKQGHARRATLRKYGLTEDTYADLYAAQEGRCGICQKEERVLCVDHDKRTDRVRGLLCRACNRSIGQLGDTADTLQRAVDYLREAEADHSAPPPSGAAGAPTPAPEPPLPQGDLALAYEALREAACVTWGAPTVSDAAPTPPVADAEEPDWIAALRRQEAYRLRHATTEGTP